MEQHHFHRSDPLELRVLAAVAAGASTTSDVAAQVGQPESVVSAILEGAVSEQAATRLDAGPAPSYSLTPKGLEAVGIYQGVQSAVDGSGHVDLAAASRMVMEQYAAARDVAAEDAVHAQAAWPVDDATRDRVTAALNDAYARGALTQEQLGERTDRALGATTMGDLRAAADGVLELPPRLPSGIGVTRPAGGATVTLNPALKVVRWGRVARGGWFAVLGLLLLFVQPLLGLVVFLLGVAYGIWSLRRLLSSGPTNIRTR